MRAGLALVCFTFFLFSCDRTNEVDAYFTEMMEIHHKDMVIWGEIPVLKRTIQEELKSLESRPMEEADSLRIEVLTQSLEQLVSANDAMNDWMAQFETPPKGTTKEVAISYLKGQKEKMMVMGKQVSDAVIKAKEVIKLYNHE